MREILGPSLRAAAITAFIAGLAVLLLKPPSLAGLSDVLVLLAGAVAFVLVMAWVTVVLIGDEIPEPEFRRLVDRSEALALLPPPDQPPSEFDLLVMQALDDLPEQFRELLEHTPVVVSTRGHEHRAYGHYIGGTIEPRSSAPSATRSATTWAGMSAGYAASASEDGGYRGRRSRRLIRPIARSMPGARRAIRTVARSATVMWAAAASTGWTSAGRSASA
jgi:hypothetical protein